MRASPRKLHDFVSYGRPLPLPPPTRPNHSSQLAEVMSLAKMAGYSALHMPMPGLMGDTLSSGPDLPSVLPTIAFKSLNTFEAPEGRHINFHFFNNDFI